MAYVLMVVEKDWSARAARDYLVECGHRVVMEEDGAIGLSTALAHPPDIVLVDVMLPSVDGLALVTHLVATHPDRDIGIIYRTHRGGTGEPGRFPVGHRAHSFVYRGCSSWWRSDSHWQMVLNVEQLLQARVVPRETPLT